MSKTYKGVGGITLPNDEFPARIRKGFYRVLEESSENAAELGQYRLLTNAIKTCDENPGSVVVADAGVRIYPQDGSVELKDSDTTGRTNPGSDETMGETEEKLLTVRDTPETVGDRSAGLPDAFPMGTPTREGYGTDDGLNATAEEDTGGVGAVSEVPVSIVGYAKLKTLMNARMGPSPDAQLVRTYKEDSIVTVTQFCGNGWMRIICEEAEGGAAFISNEAGKYATTGSTLYVVKKDDNLWKIAEAELGDGSRYKEISAINFLVSNRIKVDMLLILPEALPTAEMD